MLSNLAIAALAAVGTVNAGPLHRRQESSTGALESASSLASEATSAASSALSSAVSAVSSTAAGESSAATTTAASKSASSHRYSLFHLPISSAFAFLFHTFVSWEVSRSTFPSVRSVGDMTCGKMIASYTLWRGNSPHHPSLCPPSPESVLTRSFLLLRLSRVLVRCCYQLRPCCYQLGRYCRQRNKPGYASPTIPIPSLRC